MISSLMRYAAVVVKARGMYGKMLTDADWHKLCEMRDVSSVYNFLRAHPAYETILGQASLDGTDDSLVRALRQAGSREYARIFSYASSMDKRYMLFTVRRFELHEILTAIRRLITGHTEPPELLFPFFAEKSGINLGQLRMADDPPSVLAAIHGSIYEAPLRGIFQNAGGELPEYSQISVLLENRYYSCLYSFLKKDYKGSGRDSLLAGLALEADAINIVSIFRLRRYFPGSFGGVDKLLLPIGRRLPTELRQSLIDAPSEEAMLNVLRATRWGKYFDSLGTRPLEYAYEKALEDFSRKLLRGDTASICVPQAYLTLRDIEIKKLIRVIKAVSYGREPSKIL